MSVSIKMPYNSRFYELNESRIGRLLNSDKKEATYMGLWDRFKDNFRTEKKAEAIERLYDFIHAEDPIPTENNNNTTYAGQTIESFHKIKSLAKDEHKESFHTEANPYDGVDFYIGEHQVKSLDNSVASLALYELNHDSSIKTTISNTLNDLVMQPKQADLEQMIKDLTRQEVCVVDGKVLSNHGKAEQKIIAEHTHSFYESLTPEQKNAIPEVASQGLFATVPQLFVNEGTLFGQNVFIGCGNPSTRTVLHRNEGSCDITVIQTLFRDRTESYYNMQPELTSFGLKDLYPTLQLDMAFTISSDGNVTCTLVNVSNEILPIAHSFSELQSLMTHKQSQ